MLDYEQGGNKVVAVFKPIRGKKNCCIPGVMLYEMYFAVLIANDTETEGIYAIPWIDSRWKDECLEAENISCLLDLYVGLAVCAHCLPNTQP